MDKNIVDFEDYNIKVDLKEIEKMNREEIERCRNKIQEIKKMLNERSK